MAEASKYSLDSGARITFATSGKHHFFGYYDKCPWSKDGRFLLALEADFLDRMPTERDTAVVGIIDLKGDRKFKKIAEARAWNWQQGSMLQWLGPDFQSRIIFNDFRDGEFVSVIFNVISGKEEKVVQVPIYAVHPNGRCALSLNFSRIDDVREGYGYKGVKDPSVSEKKPENDGIYFVDLEKNKKFLIISLAQLSEHLPISSMSEGKHWADHVTFSSDGMRFAFLHRWQLENRGMHSRLCVADLEDAVVKSGSQISSVVLLDSGMASHFTWKSDNELLVWGRPAGTSASVGRTGIARRILVPIYHKLFKSSPALKQKISGDAFLLFKLNDELKDYSVKPIAIGRGVVKEDCHCSFSPDNEWLLTHT
ncbi:hypothetical protein D4R51_01415 [bacterium]|nr:MAG: hypothetical protein D4R51_01415 [bacterium]